MSSRQIRRLCSRRGICANAGCSAQNPTSGASSCSDSGDMSDWFSGRLSKTIPREYQYDPLSRSAPIDPEKIVELDYMSMCGLKTSELPEEIQGKVLRLLEQFGYKGDLERFGKYMVARFRSRASTETPKVLPSVVIPERSMKKNKTPLERLFGAKGFDDLRGAMPHLFSEEGANNLSSAYTQAAIASAEDEKHKLYQMFYSPGTAVTYLAHRFPSTYASNFRVLMEIFKRAPDFNPQRILDYGSGPAVSAQAALQIWQNEETRSVTCVEPSLNMQQIGKYLMAYSKVKELSWQIGLHGVQGQFDLITVSYVLMEIRDQDSRDLLINNLFMRLRPGGILVVVDCGTPTGFRYIHRIREMFILKDLQQKTDNKSFHIVAPCPHESACPLALTGKDWCHFDQQVRRLPHSVYSKGNRKNNTDYEKFSYIVLRKGAGPREEFPSEHAAPTSWEKSYFWPRIVMPAIKAGGHTLLDVCARPNNFERLVVSKSKPHTFGYRFSRKVMWGDLWRYPKRLVRREARESYTPDEVKRHLDKLHEEAKVAKEDIEKYPEGKKLEEASYGQ
jgi:ribosomal protein RSM22 (predicted rRNA methylase)